LKHAVVKLDRYLNKMRWRPIDLLRQLEDRDPQSRSENKYGGFIANCEGVNKDAVFTVRKLKRFLTHQNHAQGLQLSSGEVQLLCQALSASSGSGKRKGQIDLTAISRLMCLKQAPVSGTTMPAIMQKFHAQQQQQQGRAGAKTTVEHTDAAVLGTARSVKGGDAAVAQTTTTTDHDRAILAYLLQTQGGVSGDGGGRPGENLGRSLLRRRGPVPQVMFRGMRGANMGMNDVAGVDVNGSSGSNSGSCDGSGVLYTGRHATGRSSSRSVLPVEYKNHNKGGYLSALQLQMRMKQQGPAR
jgi:hypothetical protein